MYSMNSVSGGNVKIHYGIDYWHVYILHLLSYNKFGFFLAEHAYYKSKDTMT